MKLLLELLRNESKINCYTKVKTNVLKIIDKTEFTKKGCISDGGQCFQFSIYFNIEDTATLG